MRGKNSRERRKGKELPALVIGGALLASASESYAQQLPEHGGRTSTEVYLSIGVLVFGILLIGLQVLVMLKMAKGWETHSTRMVGLTLVIVAGLFLITAGYSQDQIAPMVGLLGTIAGYLLGKTSPKDEA
jgi:peptidoglycan/LPS O-acetylase OafA/YrhL